MNIEDQQEEAHAFYQPDSYKPEDSVGLLMRRAVSSILAHADRELAYLDVTHAQWVPLYKMSVYGSYTVAKLAKVSMLDPGATTRLLDRMEAKGLVRRQRSTTDRRVVHLELTPQGKRVADLVPEVLCKVLNQHLRGFSQQEWLQFRNMLERMLANGEVLNSACPLSEPVNAGPPTPLRDLDG
jgi:DNA-binding MarR family transcriptional regulator